MISLALLLLAATPTGGMSVTVVAIDSRFPYYGAPGNTCQRGTFFVRGVLADPQDGLSARTPVVVRLVDAAGLTPGSDAVFDDVRRAGTGQDGTAVFCATGPRTASNPPPPAAVAPAAEPPTASRSPARDRCVFRLFSIVKKPLGADKFGESQFDPNSELTSPEASGTVDCGLARSRVTNVLLLRMVKDGFTPPEAVVGAEWDPGSSWQSAAGDDGKPAPQKRIVKVYLVEDPTTTSR